MLRLARSTDGALRVYRHTGDPAAPLAGTGDVLGLGWQAATAITLGDVTLDGKVDLVAGRRRHPALTAVHLRCTRGSAGRSGF